MDGMYDDDAQEIDSYSLIDENIRIPAWILRKIPMWNEKVSDRLSKLISVCSSGKAANLSEEEKRFMTDMKNVRDVVWSGYVVDDAEYKVLDTKHGKIGVAVRAQFTKVDTKWLAYKTTFTENCTAITERGFVEYNDPNQVIYEHFYVGKDNKDEFGDFETLGRVGLMCYTYIKSIYEDVVCRRKRYSLIPISDILMITAKGYSDDEPKELWNNLDQTVHGNV
jgi:hypothetical protein